MRLKFVISPGNSYLIDKILNPAYWMLRTYYKFRSPTNYNKITWLNAQFDFILDNDAFIKEIIEQKVDILCFSFYVWNRHQYLYIAEKCKELNPNLIIIAGGPELNAHKDANFFNTYPFLDYVVYGDGELAFKFLLDHIISGESLDNAVNLVTPQKIYPFKVFVDKEYSEISPWLEMEEDIRKIIAESTNFKSIRMHWEMSRGCPYACSFCDWTSGLHNKVKRRNANWKAEIDLFAELGVEIGVIDANWGTFKEDIEIHKYAVKKLGKKFYTQNLSKLNKKTVYEMMGIQADAYKDELYYNTISLQDINPIVLENIDRPEIPWEEHKKLIIELVRKHPNIRPQPEFIIGLPGQTPESFLESIIEVHSIGATRLAHHHWMVLTNSPASNEEYQNKFKLKIEDMVFPANIVLPNKDAVYQSIKNKDKNTLITKTVTGTYSASLADLLTMHCYASIFNAVLQVIPQVNPIKIIEKNNSRIKEVTSKQAEIINQDKIFGVQNIIGFVDYRRQFFTITEPKKLLEQFKFFGIM